MPIWHRYSNLGGWSLLIIFAFRLKYSNRTVRYCNRAVSYSNRAAIVPRINFKRCNLQNFPVETYPQTLLEELWFAYLLHLLQNPYLKIFCYAYAIQHNS